MSTVNASGNLYIRDNAGTPEYSLNNSIWTVITFPLTIVNTDAASTMLVVNFTTDLTLSDTNNNHFKTGSNRIQYGSTNLLPNGARPVISINNVSNYTGLIENGTSSTIAYSNIYVCNLIVQATGTTTLNTDAAWIGRPNYAKAASNNYIINCSTIGNINNNGGGIVPSYSALNGGNLVIRGCSSSGSIAQNAGGIVGYLSATSPGSTITLENCSSSGSIGLNAGGIIGSDCSGSITCINCYSSGSISPNAGGIFGISTGGSATAINCYSTGEIGLGFGFGGGIFGGNAASSGGTTNATNCYSTGDIKNFSGGIYAGGSSSNATANNCYTSGISSFGAGGIWSGSSSNTLYGVNNYAEANASSSGWNDSNASVTLQSVGTIWLSTTPNTPYILNNMNSSPYRLDTINPANSYNLNTSYTYPLPIIVGTSTASADIAGFTNFTLINNTESTITINSSGVLTTTLDTPLATYTLIIYAEGINPYSVSTLILTVAPIPPPPTPPSQPTLLYATADRYRGDDNELITIYHVGNTLIADKQQNTRCEFPSYKDYIYYRISAGASFT